MSHQPRNHWPAMVKTLHWLSLLVILSVAILGLVMVDLQKGSDIRKLCYGIHKSLGITVLALAVLRVVVRLSTGAPAALPGPAWQRRVAATTHVLIYVLLLSVPLSGWLLNSVAGQPLPWFWLFNVPALTGKHPEWREALDGAHVYLFWTLASLVVVHVGAALYHHLFEGDATLRRMLPGCSTQQR